jgi:hypothetical protein
VYALTCWKLIGHIDVTGPCTTKVNPGFDYALACPYNVRVNLGWTEIGHVGRKLGLIDVTVIQVDH